MTTKTFDSKCYELAEAFLTDSDTFHLHSEARCNALAAEIQQTIEDFIADELRNYEPPDPPGFEGGFADNH